MEQLLIDKMKSGPSQLAFLSILKVRSPKLFAEHTNLYKRLTAGKMGEEEVLHYFREFGQPHWRYIQNYWANSNGVAESDLLVFTNTSCYVLEVKNYTGKFEYENGATTIDGYEYSSDSIFQARRSFKNIRKILAGHVHPDNVHGALVFIGENNEVAIHSQVDDIEIVQRNQLMNFIRKIAVDEQTSLYGSLRIDRIQHQLNRFQVANPFVIPSLTADQTRLLHTGITCAYCSSLDTKLTRKFVKCKCGHKELREAATLRTIEEYSVLRYDAKLRVNSLFEFMGGHNSKSYLLDILSCHFEMIRQGRYTYYVKKLSNHSHTLL